MHGSLCWLQHYPSLDIQDGLAGRILSDAKLLERFNAMGARPGGIPSAEFDSFMKSELKMWSEISKSAGVKPE